MKKTINILLQNFPYRSANKGCEALCFSIFYIIDQIATELNVNYKIFFINRNFKKNFKDFIFINNKKINIDYLNVPRYLGLRSVIKTLWNFRYYYKDLKKLNSIDFGLDIGEGDSFSDIYGSYRFHYINLAHKITSFFKIPFYILPQTIGPFNNHLLKQLAIKSMNKAEEVMTRDKQSSDYVYTLTNKYPLQFIDIAFALPYNKITFDPNLIHVGLNISGLLWNGGYTKDNQFNLSLNYQQVVLKLIDRFLENKNVRIHLISHVFNLDKNLLENDFSVLNDIYKKYNNPQIILAPLFFDPIEAKSYIAGMDFFLGARMHATIAAFSSGVPVVPMAYSRKFNGLFKDTLKYDPLVDMKVDKTEEAIEKIMFFYNNRNELKKIINKNNLEIVKPNIDKFKNKISLIISQFDKNEN